MHVLEELSTSSPEEHFDFTMIEVAITVLKFIARLLDYGTATSVRIVMGSEICPTVALTAASTVASTWLLRGLMAFKSDFKATSGAAPTATHTGAPTVDQTAAPAAPTAASPAAPTADHTADPIRLCHLLLTAAVTTAEPAAAPAVLMAIKSVSNSFPDPAGLGQLCSAVLDTRAAIMFAKTLCEE